MPGKKAVEGNRAAAQALRRIFGLESSFQIINTLGKVSNSQRATDLMIDRRISHRNQQSAGMYQAGISASYATTPVSGNESVIGTAKDLAAILVSIDGTEDNKRLQITEALLEITVSADHAVTIYPFISEQENGEVVSVGQFTAVDPIVLIENSLSGGTYKYKLMSPLRPRPFYDNGTVRRIQTAEYDVTKILQKWNDNRFLKDFDNENLHPLGLGYVAIFNADGYSGTFTGTLFINYSLKEVKL